MIPDCITELSNMIADWGNLMSDLGNMIADWSNMIADLGKIKYPNLGITYHN